MGSKVRMSRRFYWTSVATLVVGVTWSAPSHADTQHQVAVTFSPLHLVSPIVELTGEFRLHDKFSVAAIAGVGSITTEVPDGSTEEEKSFSAWELGGQGRFYLLGDFDHGMQLGVELLYVNVDFDEADVSGTGNGLALGPFIGYKVSAGFGLTFDAQLGFQYLAATAEASSGTDSASASDSTTIPLLNLNLGWAF
jgi:hypothetical protein